MCLPPIAGSPSLLKALHKVLQHNVSFWWYSFGKPFDYEVLARFHSYQSCITCIYRRGIMLALLPLLSLCRLKLMGCLLKFKVH